MGVEVFNKTRRRIDGRSLVLTGDRILKKFKKSKMDVNIVLVGETKIRNLNRIYRHKDKVTDVLSFEGQGGDWKGAAVGAGALVAESNNFLGEIFICASKARKQAEKFGHSLNQELAILTVHGILHLLGLTHKQMEEKGWGMGEGNLKVS